MAVSSRPLNFWVISEVLAFVHGQTKSAKIAMMMIHGVANRRTGTYKLRRLRPLAYQTTISESLCQRMRTIMVATKRETERIMEIYPMTASIIKTTTSLGLMEPEAAKPKILMTRVVIMIVINTRKTAPVV